MRNKLFLLLILIQFILFTSCSDTQTNHTFYVRNNTSDFKIKVLATTTDENIEFDLNFQNEGNQDFYKRIYFEYFQEGDLPEFDNNAFAERVKSVKIYKYENDTLLTEVIADKEFNNLDLWEIRPGNDDQTDYYEYWLNITDEMAKN